MSSYNQVILGLAIVILPQHVGLTRFRPIRFVHVILWIEHFEWIGHYAESNKSTLTLPEDLRGLHVTLSGARENPRAHSQTLVVDDNVKQK